LGAKAALKTAYIFKGNYRVNHYFFVSGLAQNSLFGVGAVPVYFSHVLLT